MKLPLIALALTALTAGVYADNNASGTTLVPNNHGGYNVTQTGAPHASIPFFGSHGFAATVAEHSHEKPKFILQPGSQDDGHGNKHTVYKKIRFATAEEAEAAKLKSN